MPPTLQRPAARQFDIPERLNIPADRLQKEMEWIGQAQDMPPQIATAIAATLWLLQVDAFREQEEKFMLSGEYEASLPDHRVILTQIIANGEQVVFAAQKSGMVSTPAGFALNDLKSTLNSLNATFRGEHGTKNPPKTKELIERLLNG